MSKRSTVQNELEAIKLVLKDFAEGATLDDIAQAASLEYLPLRTLQRRLLKLTHSGHVVTKGKTRSTRYYLVTLENHSNSSAFDELIPLSAPARDILRVIKRPLQKRMPVGYQPNFLDNYQANIDAYLSKQELEKLAALSKISDASQVAGTYARDILNRLLIDLSWNSSRLEGNTYSLLDTQRLISFGQIADGKSLLESQMILNHKDAIEFLVETHEDIGFNPYTLLNLHAILSNNLLADPQASGRLRTIAVGIHHSVYEPLAVPSIIEETFKLVLEKCSQINNPFEQAFFIMVHLPYLQPFDDVNKRVSRLAANIPLVSHKLSPLSFVDVPDDLYIQGMLAIYENNRVELLKDVFIWAYERSSSRYAALQQSLGEPNPFRLKYRDDMRALISIIISSAMPQHTALVKIQEASKKLPLQDQNQFIEAVEAELLSLHKGNFARYKVRPSEFEKWFAVWRI